MGDGWFRFGLALEVFFYTILLCLTLISILAWNGFRWDRSEPVILGNGASIKQSSRTKCLKMWSRVCFFVVPIVCTVSVILHLCKRRHDYGMSHALYIWWTYSFCVIDSLFIFQAYLFFPRRYWRWIILPILAILILFCFIAGTIIGARGTAWNETSMGATHLMSRAVANIIATVSIIYVIYQQECHGGRAQLEALSRDELDPLIGAFGDEDIDINVDVHEKLRVKWPRLVSRILFESFLCYTVFSFIISVIGASCFEWYSVVGYGDDGADALLPMLVQTGGIAINLMFISMCFNNSRQSGSGDNKQALSTHHGANIPTDVLYSPNHNSDEGILARDVSVRAQTQSPLRGARTESAIVSGQVMVVDRNLVQEVQGLKERMDTILSVISERGIDVQVAPNPPKPEVKQPAGSESLEGRAGPSLDPDYVDLGHPGKEGPIRL